MRDVMLDVPEQLLEERRRMGLDGRDEVWDGVLHMVPPAGGPHQCLAGELFMALGPIAKSVGIVPSYETGVFRSNTKKDDYRVPDLVFAREENRSKRGVEERAELLIEILSPDDETYKKIPFYEKVAVQELLIVDPDTRAIELYVRRGKRLVQTSTDADGRFHSEVLPVTFATIDGPKLKITWSNGQVEI